MHDAMEFRQVQMWIGAMLACVGLICDTITSYWAPGPAEGVFVLPVFVSAFGVATVVAASWKKREPQIDEVKP